MAVLLGILLQPFTFLYLNKVKIFWIYFLLVAVTLIVDWYLQFYISFVFSVVCPIHAYVIYKSYDAALLRRWYSRWWGIPTIYIALFIPVFCIRSFLYEPFSIPAASMSPSLNVGDNIIVKKSGYGSYGTYGLSVFNAGVSDSTMMQRGKIYAFYPPHSDIPFVKRLIALPGDTVELRGKEVQINGERLKTTLMYETDSSTVYEETIDNSSYFIKQHIGRPFMAGADLVIPENRYFFLGDNRDNSSDSRVWDTVPDDRILGEVVYVFRK